MEDLDPEEARRGLRQWFSSNDYSGEDPFRLWGEFEYRMPLPPKLRFALFKIAVEPFASSRKTGLPPAYAFLLRAGAVEGDRVLVREMFRRLADSRITSGELSCWGLPFPATGNPPNSPYAINTLFAADALLDAFSAFGKKRFLSMAESAARWVVEECMDGGKTRVKFSPSNDFFAYNVSAEAAKVFYKLSQATGNDFYARLAKNCVDYVEKNSRGYYWLYSDKSKQFDVVHNSMIYASLYEYYSCKSAGRVPSRVHSGFGKFFERALREEKNLWDYAKLLEASVLLGREWTSIWLDARKLWDGNKKAFRFAHSPRWLMVGWFKKSYIRHNAFMYYALSLLKRGLP